MYDTAIINCFMTKMMTSGFVRLSTLLDRPLTKQKGKDSRFARLSSSSLHSSSSVRICTRIGDEHAHMRVAGTQTYVHFERTFETYVFIPNVRSKRTFILRTYVRNVRLYSERTFETYVCTWNVRFCFVTNGLPCYKRLAIRPGFRGYVYVHCPTPEGCAERACVTHHVSVNGL